MRIHTGVLMTSLIVAMACSSSPTAPTEAAVGVVAPTTLPPTTTPTTSTAANPTSSSPSLPAMYQRFSSAVSVTMSGSTVVLSSNGTPDHRSPYYGSGHALYEAPHAGMVVNPNRIAASSLVLRVPAAPVVGTASDTPMGAIGMATNGVAIFNQYAAFQSPLDNEIPTFDRYNGHPQQTGQYHYHIEPVWLTQADRSALVGVLLDGFPVYGPEEVGGSRPGGLDSCNGHTHATPEFPDGTYHYHVTAASPYISGCYRGAPGSRG